MRMNTMRMNVLVMMLAASAIIPACQGKTEDKPTVSDRWVTAIDGLRLRQAPEVAGPVLTAIPWGSRVALLSEKDPVIELSGKRGKWSEVQWEGKKGWAFGGFLSAKKPAETKLDKVLLGTWNAVEGGPAGFTLKEDSFSWSNGGTSVAGTVTGVEREGLVYRFKVKGREHVGQAAPDVRQRDGEWEVRVRALGAGRVEMAIIEPGKTGAYNGVPATYRK